jgi:hypothetical protein
MYVIDQANRLVLNVAACYAATLPAFPPACGAELMAEVECLAECRYCAPAYAQDSCLRHAQAICAGGVTAACAAAVSDAAVLAQAQTTCFGRTYVDAQPDRAGFIHFGDYLCGDAPNLDAGTDARD